MAVMRRVLVLAVLAAAAVVATWPTGAGAHPERDSFYPNFDRSAQQFMPAFGHVPATKPIFSRRGGKRLVVCKSDSRKRIKRIGGSRKLRRLRRANLRLLRKCKFRNIQSAINRSKTGYRIALLPGVYKEKPSLRSPNPDQRCAGMYTFADRGANQTLARGAPIPSEQIQGSYEYHRNCPNSQNLIAVVGDGPDADRKCDHRCNLTIAGTGRSKDVVIDGQRKKNNVIKADRADGITLRNFTIQYSDFNNVYVLETNGFTVSRIRTRYSREYGILSFASDHGLYTRINAYGSGDSGIYPGAGPEGHCSRYGIEIRNSDSHDNNIGYSGTAGNGVWAHNNKFHNNSTGMTTDSFAGGHPGMPQDCAKWENNRIYSNNFDLWDKAHDDYCDINKRSIAQRDPKYVCPTFQNPAGTGILIAGGNGNIVRGNRIYDNYRDGAKLFWVPRELRGEDPTGQSVNTSNNFDTSLDNRFTSNVMGIAPNGQRKPNGNDFWWDYEGKGNCWQGNRAYPGRHITTNAPTLDGCPGRAVLLPGNAADQASQVSCATWNPYDPVLHDPPGCDWFMVPPKPQ